jgi:hypothetical protein
MNHRIVAVALAVSSAIGFVHSLQANEPAEDAQASSQSTPVIVVIGAGETPLGATRAGGDADIIGNLVESLYVTSHNKANRRYSQRAFDALRSKDTARLEEAARAAFGCSSTEPGSDACKSVLVWPIANGLLPSTDATKILEEHGWSTALIVSFWIQSSEDGIAVRGFVQRHPDTRRDTKELLPLGYIEAAPADVMRAAATHRKRDEWLMENYWLSAQGNELPDVFVRGMNELKALLDHVDPSDGSVNAQKLLRSQKRRDQLRYHKSQGIGCKNMAHCNSIVSKQFPSRLWLVRAAVGYAYMLEVVSEPILVVQKQESLQKQQK